MSSKTKFKCDFCGGTIVKAAKAGARGYCGKRNYGGENIYVEWDIDPFANMEGPHICGDCVDSLVKSKAFQSVGAYIDK